MRVCVRALTSRLCRHCTDVHSFTQAPDASGNAVPDAYRMLDVELQAGPVRPTAAPSMQQSKQRAPSNESAEASSALAAKRGLPQDTLRDLLEDAGLSQYCEAISAQGYTCALDLAEASPEELAQLVLDLQLRPPEGRRLQRSVQRLARPQQ